jgi:hypothetical protein
MEVPMEILTAVKIAGKDAGKYTKRKSPNLPAPRDFTESINVFGKPADSSLTTTRIWKKSIRLIRKILEKSLMPKSTYITGRSTIFGIGYKTEIRGEKILFTACIWPRTRPAGTAVIIARIMAVITLRLLTKKCMPSSPAINCIKRGTTFKGEGIMELFIIKARIVHNRKNMAIPVRISFKECCFIPEIPIHL